MGFGTPQDEWFREEMWQTAIWEVLNSRQFADRKLVDVNKAKEKYRLHLEGKANVSKEIWKWVHLELWFREFID